MKMRQLQLLAGILGEFNTKELLPIVTVSHRFCSIATQILHQRLVASPSRSSHSVVLECCHPSTRISTPYFRCQYVGDAACDGPPINERDPSFGDLRRIYTCFRPVVVESNRRKRFRYGWSAETMNGDSTQLQIAADDDEEAGDTVHQEVCLDEGERFSQLCAAANVVIHGSRPGLFMRHVNMSDGVIRVFRGWLASMLPGHSSSHAESAATETASISESGLFSSDDSRVLWVDRTKNVGIRFRVTPGPDAGGTICEDEPPVFYNLTYEELVVRASTLLLATDEADVQHAAHSGKDIVFAPFTIL
ncbi:hypothetical protein ACQKWADRAFT_266556 [Trichoderma austrokoningii]